MSVAQAGHALWREENDFALPCDDYGAAQREFTMRPVDIAKEIATRRRSAYTELHWVPRLPEQTPGGPSVRQHCSILGPDLVGQDWAAIDPMMVRSSKGVRHRFTPSLYFWERTRSHIWCESQEERWEVLWLDYGGQVERLWAQPLAIAFGHGSRLSGDWHFPDLLAQFTDGSFGLFDVRPAPLIDAHTRTQFDETAVVCDTIGLKYHVLTGHDPLATRNLDCLSASRHDRCRPTPELEEVILAAGRDGETRGELCRIASPGCPPLACAWVDNLAWRRLLHIDIATVISSATVYTTSKGAIAHV